MGEERKEKEEWIGREAALYAPATPRASPTISQSTGVILVLRDLNLLYALAHNLARLPQFLYP